MFSFPNNMEVTFWVTLQDSSFILLSLLLFLISRVMPSKNFILFWPRPTMRVLSSPHPGIKPMPPPALEMQSQSLNHQRSPKEFYKKKNSSVVLDTFQVSSKVNVVQLVTPGDSVDTGHFLYQRKVWTVLCAGMSSSLALPPPWKFLLLTTALYPSFFFFQLVTKMLCQNLT